MCKYIHIYIYIHIGICVYILAQALLADCWLGWGAENRRRSAQDIVFEHL